MLGGVIDDSAKIHNRELIGFDLLSGIEEAATSGNKTVPIEDQFILPAPLIDIDEGQIALVSNQSFHSGFGLTLDER